MHKSKAALFLMELLIVLLFFSIAGAISLQLFSDAHITNKNSQDRSNANILLTNTAENFYNIDSSELSEGETINYYSKDLYNAEAGSPYAVTSTVSFDDSFWNNHIVITRTKDDRILIEQDIVRYEREVRP